MTDGGGRRELCVLRYVRLTLRAFVTFEGEGARDETDDEQCGFSGFALYVSHVQTGTQQTTRACVYVCVFVCVCVCECFVLYSSVVLKPSRENLFA